MEARLPKTGRANKKRTPPARKTLFYDSDEDQDDIFDNLTDDENERISNPTIVSENSFPPLTSKPEEGDYVLVKFPGKFYAGKILTPEDEDGDLEISYLRNSIQVEGKFVLPPVPDLKSVNIKDISMILPRPTVSGTKRQQNFLEFAVDLSKLKLG